MIADHGNNVHIAKMRDLQQICDLIEQYYEKTHFKNKVTFDWNKCAIRVMQFIQSPRHYVCVAKNQNTVIGVSMFGEIDDFSQEKVVSIVLFYVDSDMSALEDSNKMLEFIIEICKMDCVDYIWTAPNVQFLTKDEAIKRSFAMLVKRHGFEEFGSQQCFALDMEEIYGRNR